MDTLKNAMTCNIDNFEQGVKNTLSTLSKLKEALPKVFYLEDERFKEYVNKYSKTRKIPVEECLKHKLVRAVCEQYNKERSNMMDEK